MEIRQQGFYHLLFSGLSFLFSFVILLVIASNTYKPCWSDFNLALLDSIPMLSPLRASLNTLRTGLTTYSTINKPSHIAAMGQRLFSQYQQQPQTPNYKVEPVPRDLIPSLGQSKQQILWLGCSDSGYEETTTLNHLLEDEMIVVRNWGNMALSTDLAWASAVQHAVDMLEVNRLYIYPLCMFLAYTFTGQAYYCLWTLWMWHRQDRLRHQLSIPLAEVCLLSFPLFMYILTI
jgi:hypothetical protein